jgi:hypothetical protein
MKHIQLLYTWQLSYADRKSYVGFIDLTRSDALCAFLLRIRHRLGGLFRLMLSCSLIAVC